MSSFFDFLRYEKYTLQKKVKKPVQLLQQYNFLNQACKH